MLKVKIAEVSRDLLKQVGVNLLSRDPTSGFQFGIGQGSPGTFGPAARRMALRLPPKSFNILASGTTLGMAGHLLGLDLLSTLNLAETDGLATILAEPTLTALSGKPRASSRAVSFRSLSRNLSAQ